jgi:hypothetical protein
MRVGHGGLPAIVALGIFAVGLAFIFFLAYGRTPPSAEWIGGFGLHFPAREISHPPSANSSPSAPSDVASPRPSATTTAATAPTDVKALAPEVEKTNASRAPTLRPTVQLPAGAFQPDVAQSEFSKYCTPPLSPSCIQREETYKEPANTEACQKEIDEYINEALRYRTCLEEQIERAVKNANDIVDNFKCRTQGRSDCQARH